MRHNEKGVSLVITFLIMTVMLAIALSISSIVAGEIRIVANIGNAIPSFYAAETGAEKTLYYDAKQIPLGGARGLCNLCNSCSGTSCASCLATPLATGGCNSTNCKNCQITYTSTFDERSYNVTARVVPNGANPALSDFTLDVKGFYKSTSRAVQFNATY